MTACHSPTSGPRDAPAIAEALGLTRPIELRVEGQPLDALGVDEATLSSSQALALAIENSPEIQAGLARVRASLAAADQARLWPNPLLEFVLRLPEGGGRADVEVGVASDLIQILRRGSDADAADERLAASVSEAVATATGVAAEVMERYAAVRAIDELLPVTRERRALVGKLVEVSRSRFEHGEASRAEVTQLEANAVELDVEVRNLEGDSRDERLALARRLGRPSSAATWTLAPIESELRGERTEADWIELALAHHPEIEIARRRVGALGIEAEAVDATRWNGLEAGAKFERGESWSAGPAVAVPLPIFDDGSAKRDLSGARVVEARHELVEAQRRVVEEVRRALAVHAAAHAALARVRDELIPLQTARRTQMESAFEAGQVGVGALLMAEGDLLNARAKHIAASKRAFLALVHLERAVGGAGVARRSNEPKRNPQ